MALNYGDLLDAIAPLKAKQLAIVSDECELTWELFDGRTNALARGLKSLGVTVGDKVCFLMPNGASYIETLAACFKGRFVHANLNFRYRSSEIEYIVENADGRVLVFDPRFADQVEGLNPKFREGLILIEAGDHDTPSLGVTTIGNLVRQNDDHVLDIERSPEDIVFIYTGGTTGMPKGVMWEQGEQVKGLLGGRLTDGSVPKTTREFIARLDEPKPYSRTLIASPLMHAAGMYGVIGTLLNGGVAVVSDNAASFNASRHWELIEKYQLDALSIIGDTFAKPLLAALKQKDYNLSSLKLIASSGVIWSMGVKRGLLEYLPQCSLYDSLGSTEAQSLGASITTANSEAVEAEFRISEECRVVTEDGVDVIANNTDVGMLLRDGPKPLGYYKDHVKTAAMFREVDGRNYIVTGDMCTVSPDGIINLLGRGNQCINSGGEKIFPSEIEQTLVLHPLIRDALVFGMPDPKWGQAVQAVAQLIDDETCCSDDIRDFLRERLAGYKVPKEIVFTYESLRLVNGKANYRGAKKIYKTRSY